VDCARARNDGLEGLSRFEPEQPMVWFCEEMEIGELEHALRAEPGLPGAGAAAACCIGLCHSVGRFPHCVKQSIRDLAPDRGGGNSTMTEV
jgi:hypothetical protein